MLYTGSTSLIKKTYRKFIYPSHYPFVDIQQLYQKLPKLNLLSIEKTPFKLLLSFQVLAMSGIVTAFLRTKSQKFGRVFFFPGQFTFIALYWPALLTLHRSCNLNVSDPIFPCVAALPASSTAPCDFRTTKHFPCPNWSSWQEVPWWDRIN